MLQENTEKSMKQYADNYDKIRSQLFFDTLVFSTIYFFFQCHFSISVSSYNLCVCHHHEAYIHAINEYERLSGWMSGMQALSF